MSEKNNKHLITIKIGDVSFQINADEQNVNSLRNTENFADGLFKERVSKSNQEELYEVYAQLFFLACDYYLSKKDELEREKAKQLTYRNELLSFVEQRKQRLGALCDSSNCVEALQQNDVSLVYEEQSECEEETTVSSSQSELSTPMVRVFYEPDEPDGELEEHCYSIDSIDEKAISFFQSD